MKALHFGQESIVMGQVTILNKHKHRLTTDNHDDRFALISKKDYVLVGSKIKGEIVVGKNQHFDINGLHSK